MPNVIVVNNTSAIKYEDNVTPIEFILVDDNQIAYDLTNRKIVARIKNDYGYLTEFPVTEIVNKTRLIVRIPEDAAAKIGSGFMYMELVLDDEMILPNDGFIQFRIISNAKSMGDRVTTVTFDYFVSKFDLLGKDVKQIALDSATLKQETIDKADQSIATANKVQEQFNKVVGSTSIDPDVTAAHIGADGETYNSLGERLDAEYQNQRNSIVKTESDIVDLMRYSPTVMSQARLAFDDDYGSYDAWPYGCLFMDGDTLVQFYTTGSSHVANDKKVYLRKLDTKKSEVWGSRIPTPDRLSEGYGATVHAAGMTPNGDYIAIVRFTDDRNLIVATWLIRSSDKGSTWVGKQWIVDGSAVQPEEAGSIFVTKNGTILTFFRSQLDRYFVTRSNDNGNTWSNVQITNNIGGDPLEGSFVQLADGTIVCLVRHYIGGAPYSNKEKGIYTISKDDGKTWTEFAYSDIEDMNNNPSAMIFHEKENIVEVFYGSRRPHEIDGFGSIYQSVTTPENIVLGKFGTPKRIALGSPTRDFGYPAAVKNNAGKVFLTFYNGYDPTTQILMMTGTRSLTNNAQDVKKDLVNPFTGVSHVSYGKENDATIERINNLRFKNLPLGNIRFGIENRFNNASEIVAVSSVPGSTQWQTLSADVLTGGKFGTGIGAYVIEVVYEIASNVEQNISFSHNRNPTPRGSRIIKKNATADPVKENKILTVPCVTSGMGLDATTYPVGSIAYKLSDNTKFNSLQINVIGWINSN